MARAARREPTVRELDERLTRLEHQVADIATTVADTNRVAVQEVQAFHSAFIEHGEETRKAFAETHAIIHRLGGAVEAGFKTTFNQIAELRTELKADIADVRTELRGDIAGLRIEIIAQFEKLARKPPEN
jgi:hypothetical protein